MPNDEDKQTPNDISPEESEDKISASTRNLIRVNDELFGIILGVATEELSVDDGSVVAKIMSGLQSHREREVFSLVLDAAKKVISQADNYIKHEQGAHDSNAAEVPVISVESIHIEELDIVDPTTDEDSLAGEHQITLIHTMLSDIQREIRSLNEKLSSKEQGMVERLVKKTTAKTAKRIPNLEPRRKIRALADYRQNYIEEYSSAPKWTLSCQLIPINSETVRDNAPRLREHWGEISYIWSEDQEDWD